MPLIDVLKVSLNRQTPGGMRIGHPTGFGPDSQACVNHLYSPGDPGLPIPRPRPAPIWCPSGGLSYRLFDASPHACMPTGQLIRTLTHQQPHHTGVCHRPSAGNHQDVVLSSRAICCPVAKQQQEVPTPFQSETQVVWVTSACSPGMLCPSSDFVSDSIAAEPQNATPRSSVVAPQNLSIFLLQPVRANPRTAHDHHPASSPIETDV